MDWMSMIGMIGQLAGSATGAAMGSIDQQKAMELIKASVDEYGKINVPKLQQLVLQQNKGTELANVKDDPTYRSQQNAADAQLDDVIRSGGLTLADKAALNAIRNRSAQTESAGRHAIENSMAARGTLDSGSQLAMQLQGNQQSANELARADESQAAQAQARAFQAIRERAQLAGQGLDRTNAMKTRAAQAQDAINAGNTAIMNTANQYNAGIPQQQFNNDLTLAGAKSQPGYALAGAYAAQGKDKQQAGTAAGNVFASGVNAASKNNTGSGGGGLGYDEGAAANMPSNSSADASFGNANQGGFDSYPGNALSGESTRPDGQEIIEYDSNGKPIYGHRQPQGQNF